MSGMEKNNRCSEEHEIGGVMLKTAGKGVCCGKVGSSSYGRRPLHEQTRQDQKKQRTYFLLSSPPAKLEPKPGMKNCTFPLLLYKKCLNTVPGTMSVHLGRPCLTAVRIFSMDPFFCNCCITH